MCKGAENSTVSVTLHDWQTSIHYTHYTFTSLFCEYFKLGTCTTSPKTFPNDWSKTIYLDVTTLHRLSDFNEHVNIRKQYLSCRFSLFWGLPYVRKQLQKQQTQTRNWEVSSITMVFWLLKSLDFRPLLKCTSKTTEWRRRQFLMSPGEILWTGQQIERAGFLLSSSIKSFWLYNSHKRQQKMLQVNKTHFVQWLTQHDTK